MEKNKKIDTEIALDVPLFSFIIYFIHISSSYS